jgi:imidazolonepropionase-like amidohydrolase
MTGRKTIALFLFSAGLFAIRAGAQQDPPTTALINGKWFDGKSFQARTLYSVGGRFTSQKPSRLDKTLDLAGLWVIPPLADAHNHSIGTGVDEWDRRAINRFLADGVFYVKILGNLPLSTEAKNALPVNRPGQLDVVFGQGNITGPGGHPIGLLENVLLAQGYFPGFTRETLKDHRYFTVDSEAELDRKWPAILASKRDLVKVLLWAADEHDKRSRSPEFMFQRGLDPKLLPPIISRSHAAGLRVSAHVTTAADFRIAVEAGVDEIAHLPYLGSEPISAADAKLAAEKNIVVITTARLITWIPKNVLSDAERPLVEKAQTTNLRLLFERQVPLAIGSDNTRDTSFDEVMFLREKQVFSDLDLLRMWTGTAALSIFLGRKIGKLEDGYEASFIALEADPLKDLANVRKIKYRFKQGILLGPVANPD